MQTIAKSPKSTRQNGERKTLAEHPRKGIFVDHQAGQYATRIGCKLNESGKRVRDYQRLGRDQDTATVEHIRISGLWAKLCDSWPMYHESFRAGLPPHQKDADLAKPVWIKHEWVDAALAAEQGALSDAVAGHARQFANNIDTAKKVLGIIAQPQQDWLALVPPELRARVLQSLQPAHNEVRGVAPDARRLTIRQAADEYLAHKRTKVGLKLQGRKSGGGISGSSLNHIERMVEDALLLLDESADLRTLNHECLEKFVDDAFRKAKSPRTAFNWAKGGLKPLLDWCHKRSDIDYRNIETIDEIFRLTKPDTATKTGYTPDAVAALVRIKAAAEAKSWVFVLLAMNCGAYQVDIASWTYDNLKFTDDGLPYLWWQRQKELHHNADLWTRHDLWPEVWKQMQPFLAPNDPKKNPHGRLFLTRDGKTLYATGLDRCKRDAIRMRYVRVLEKTGAGDKDPVKLAFKQLRKIGLNAVKKFSGGSDDVARKYAGQKVPGVLRSYLNDEFEDVAAALAKWRGQLVADKIL